MNEQAVVGLDSCTLLRKKKVDHCISFGCRFEKNFRSSNINPFLQLLLWLLRWEAFPLRLQFSFYGNNLLYLGWWLRIAITYYYQIMLITQDEATLPEFKLRATKHQRPFSRLARLSLPAFMVRWQPSWLLMLNVTFNDL